MSDHLISEARSFLDGYAALFSSGDASSEETVHEVASRVAKHYRPGCTFFTNGNITSFSTQDEAASQIEQEMRKNIASGLGTYLTVEAAEISAYSDTAAIAHVTWRFRSGKADKTWTFTNVYGYRAIEGEPGWEYVLRDNEVNEMLKTVGESFLA